MPAQAPSSTGEVLAFAFFAALALLGALGTVLSRNPIRAAVGLFFHILSLAALYIVLGAHFIGVIQLLVYAGAVVVLFVFVIMLLGPAADTPKDSRGLSTRVIAGLSVAGVAALIVPQVGFIRMTLSPRPEQFGTLKQIGTYLFTEAVLPFELIGVTLVIAVLGAFAVARGQHRRPGLEAGAATREADEETSQTPGTEGRS
jgi:NADH-quinone oxidoreductase subunit J